MYPIIQLSSTIYLPSFFLVISLAVSAGIYYFAKTILRKSLDYQFHLNLALVVILSGFLGARLSHILIEQPYYYYLNPEKAFFIWEGGYIFFGGLFSALLAGLLYYKKKIKSWHNVLITMDSAAAPTALAYAIGRIGCFLAGCCYGQLSKVPWAFDGRHPTQIYASIWETGVFLILVGLDKKNPAWPPGFIFWVWMGLHGLGRFWIELLRDDFRGPAYFFSISGWVSLGLILFCFVKLMNARKSLNWR